MVEGNFKIPRWIVLQLTEKCNLRCKMCYEWGKNGSYDESHQEDLDINAIKLVVDSCKSQTPFYELFGGEPLVYPHVFEVIRYIVESGSKVSMPTNGILLEQYAQELVNSGIDTIWVSLDGPEKINDAQRGKNSYKKAIRGIEKILSLKKSNDQMFPRIGINFTVTSLNYYFVKDFFEEVIKNHKIDCINVEFQTFLTKNEICNYKKVTSEFGVKDFQSVEGFVTNIEQFHTINCNVLEQNMYDLKRLCNENKIAITNNPKSISADDYEKYFAGKWGLMSTNKKRCSLPWFHCEITARGDVVTCHAFYDIVFGNIYKHNLLSIWNGEKVKQYRSLLKNGILPICYACCLYYSE